MDCARECAQCDRAGHRLNQLEAAAVEGQWWVTGYMAEAETHARQDAHRTKQAELGVQRQDSPSDG